jgi:hypothetical protein
MKAFSLAASVCALVACQCAAAASYEQHSLNLRHIFEQFGSCGRLDGDLKFIAHPDPCTTFALGDFPLAPDSGWVIRTVSDKRTFGHEGRFPHYPALSRIAFPALSRIRAVITDHGLRALVARIAELAHGGFPQRIYA